MMNFDLFPDKLVNTGIDAGLVSKRTNWYIRQVDRTGLVEITLQDRNCYEAYDRAKYFGINVDRKWWQIWLAEPKVTYDDTRKVSKACCYY